MFDLFIYISKSMRMSAGILSELYVFLVLFSYECRLRFL